MSYAIWLEIDTGGPELVRITDVAHEYTSNCAPMWRAAGADLAEFHGKLASECVEVLAEACAVMMVDPPRFRAMNPENGWGDSDGCLKFLLKLLADLRANPKTTVCVWR